MLYGMEIGYYNFLTLSGIGIMFMCLGLMAKENGCITMSKREEELIRYYIDKKFQK